jgi:glycosyltransferase involved in cell wall biosynthesis
MRVLFDHSVPFALTHGGFEIQIEQTKLALEFIGISVEPVRWWDGAQRGEIIHYFGRPQPLYVDLAHKKGIKIVVAELLTETGSRSSTALRGQKAMIATAKKLLPESFLVRLAWDTYRMADAVVALTAWEAELMRELFDAPAERTHVVPNGVEQVFFDARATSRGKWLVCTATITERKRVLELAEAAVLARTPIWIIGKPYSERDDYAQRFVAVAKSAPDVVRYEGAISDRRRLAEIYREARGFVLLSAMESLSLSALEAAACECPLLLSNLPWAKTVFGSGASYCPVTADRAEIARTLQAFNEAAPSLRPTLKPLTWRQVAEQLQGIYERVLSSSR